MTRAERARIWFERYWACALAGLVGGLAVFATEAVDRIATLRASFDSTGEALVFATYLAPDVLMGIAAGLGFGVVFVAVGAIREGFEPLGARMWRSRAALAGAALAALAVGVATTLAVELFARAAVVEPAFKVVKKVNDRIVKLPFAVAHFDVALVFGVVAGAFVLVALEWSMASKPKGRWRIASGLVALVTASIGLGLYAVDSRLFYGRYESTMHIPATLAELVLAFLAGRFALGALGVDGVRRRVVAGAAIVTGLAVLASGLALARLGSNENLKALLWRRSVVARRAYQAAVALSDRDGDGFSSRFGGADDDGDVWVNPLATEVPGNGIDDNCFGGDGVAASSAVASPVAVAPGSAKNFVLVSIDTLRADRMSAYGYGRPTSTRLAELGTNGVFFERAYSQGTNTGLSFASMQRSATRGAVFDDGRPTMFGRFAAAGFDTRFINARRDDAWLETKRWSAYRRIILDGISTYDHTSGDQLWDGDKVTDRAIEYFSSLDPTKRHATWVHFLDPHEPRKKMAPFDFGNTSSDKYDTEVAYADREVGRLLDWMRDSGALKDTLVVLVADHGESFLDHGMDLHGNRPYHEQIWVPLMMWAPDVAPTRVSTPVGVWDVAPSALSYFGLEPIPNAEGRDVLRSPVVARPIFSETPLNLVEVSFFSYAVTDGDWRYIYDVRGNTLELYDLVNDPTELRNLVQRRPDKAAELRTILATWLDTTTSVRSLREVRHAGDADENADITSPDGD